jgi:RHS repeat-associated protein
VGFPGVGLSDYLISSPDGREVYEFDPQGRHLRTLDALTGAIRYQFAYDAGGRLVTITDVAGNVTTIARDANGTPTGIAAPFGQLTNLTFDANGYLASITDPAGQTTAFTSTSGGLLATLTDPRGATHRFTYDALGRLTLDADPAGGSTALARADSGAAFDVTQTTALGRVTIFHVASLPNGDQQRVTTLPSGLQSAYVRGANGINTETLPDGTHLSVTNGPDPRFGMLSPVPIATRVTTPLGLVLSTTTTRTATLSNPSDPLTLTALSDTLTVNGKVFTRDYATATRTLTYKTPVGRQSTVTLDELGRPIQSKVAGLNAINWTYDSHGRLARLSAGTGVDARSFALAYNSAGFLETRTDPLGRVESFVYDADGRLTTQILPDTGRINYGYDANGNVTSVTPPGRPAHTFAYTPIDLISAYLPPDYESLYADNKDRQTVLASRPGGRLVALGYGAAGRLNTLAISRGTISFGYDATRGTLTSISAPDGINLAYTYDGSLLKSVALNGSVTGTVARTHDNNFRVASLAVDGNAIALTYDDDGLLIGAGALSLTRSPLNGLLTGSTLSNVTDAWTYNGFAEPINYNAAYSGATIFAQEFTRDQLGRISQKVETIGGSTNTYVYSYDQAGRLAGVTRNGVSAATYTYDLNGNRLSVTSPGETINGTYDAQDRLTQYGTTTHSYTANGELATKTDAARVTTYTYDELGNLTAVALPGGPSISYLIDGRNRRIGKRVNGALTQGFLFQDGLKPIAELDGSNTIVSRFVYATHVNVPDYMIKSGATYRIITDHLGSPRLVVNVADGTVAQRMDYDEFGRIIQDTSPGFQPFGFAGGLYDRDTQLVRFGARDYDAKTGRWTAKDPIRFDGANANFYTYVGNAPLRFRDPSGLQRNTKIKFGDVSCRVKEFPGSSFYDCIDVNKCLVIKGEDAEDVGRCRVASQFPVYLGEQYDLPVYRLTDSGGIEIIRKHTCLEEPPKRPEENACFPPDYSDAVCLP